MTPAEHAQRIREIAFKLEKADYGMGMPRDPTEVLRLTLMLAEARRQAALAAIANYDEQAGL